MGDSGITAELVLTHRDAFALTTATAVQRAICRVADGLPLEELAEDPNVVRAFGGPEAVQELVALHGTVPDEIYVIAAIRCGKSLIAAVLALRAALTCDLSPTMEHEVPVLSVLSLKKRLAKQTFRHIVGGLARPALFPQMVGEPHWGDNAMRVYVRHAIETARIIEIVVAAGARAGADLISSWSAGVIFDEAPRMQGQNEGVINFEDARDAVADRMLPGAQLIAIGSPWAPSGPVYDLVTTHHGHPSRHIVVARAPGPIMNPRYWTPARVQKAKTRPGGERAYRTSCLAQFADSGGKMLTEYEYELVARRWPATVPPREGTQYFAAMDPATRRNAWTLVIASAEPIEGTDKVFVRIVRTRQWLPTGAKRLKGRVVLREIAEECRPYGIGEVHTDRWSSDLIEELAADPSIGLVVTENTKTGRDRTQQYLDLQKRVQEGRPDAPRELDDDEPQPEEPEEPDEGDHQLIELSPDPEYRKDILAIKLVVSRLDMSIDLPTSSDGRHCDYAPPTAIVVDLAANSGGSLGQAMARLRRDGYFTPTA